VDSSLVYLPSVAGGSQKLTILDCELTFNFHFNTYCLMICDIMYIEGRRVMDYTLSQRLKVISDKVIVPFRNKYSEEEQKNLPLLFLGKDYYDISHINTLLTFIQKFEEKDEPSGVRYLYQKRARYNDSVGLVFTSEDKCYKPGVCVSLKQWKWPKMNTFHFLVKVANHEEKPYFVFYIQADDILCEYREVSLNEESSKRLLSDLEGDTEAIVECFYDHLNAGEWIYYKLSSKKIPSSFSYILQQLEVVAENISESELTELQKPHLQSTRPSPRKYHTSRNSGYDRSNYDTSPKDEIVYESPVSMEGVENKTRKRKLSELESPETGVINVKKARLSPKVTSSSPFVINA